jgi:hypothetical protein
MSARAAHRVPAPAQRLPALRAIAEHRRRDAAEERPRSLEELAELRLRTAADIVICLTGHARALRSQPASASAAARLAREAEHLAELCASLTTSRDPRGRLAAVLAQRVAAMQGENRERSRRRAPLTDALERLCDCELLSRLAHDQASTRGERPAARRTRVAIADRALTLAEAVLTLEATTAATHGIEREPRTGPEPLTQAVRVVLRERRARRCTKPSRAALTPLPSRAPDTARALAA